MSLTSVREYFTPNGIEEVIELLGTHGDSALIVAGGSFVHGLDARDLLIGIEALIDIQNLGLNKVSSNTDGLTIGAMVKFADLQKLDEIQNSAAFGAVCDALTYPPKQIINVATVGGTIASACAYFDLPIAIMALDGVVQARGPGGSRNITLQDFFEGLFQNTLEANEFITDLFFPALPARSASAFIKLDRNANDLAIVNVAARLTLDESGTCQDARVAIGGGVAETPVRAVSAENLLQGKNISDDLIQQAGIAAQSDLDPMSDHRASGAYRSAIAKTLTERTLRRAFDRLTRT